MAVAALERAPGLLLVAVRDHDRGVQADHDDLAQVPPGRPGRRDAAVPGRDQVPDVAAGPGPCPADPGQRRRAASGQGPPRRRVRGDRAEQLFLVAQGADLADRRRAVRDRDRQVSEHPAPVMQRREPAPGQRPRQPAGQARPVREQPRRRRPRMRHDPVPADLDDQTLRPRHRIHALSAFRRREHGSSTVPLSQPGRHFSYITASLSPTVPVTVNSGGKRWSAFGFPDLYGSLAHGTAVAALALVALMIMSRPGARPAEPLAHQEPRRPTYPPRRPPMIVLVNLPSVA